MIATARRADDLAGLPGVVRLALDVTSDASVAAAPRLQAVSMCW